MKYYSAISEKNYIMSFAVTWMELEITMNFSINSYRDYIFPKFTLECSLDWQERIRSRCPTVFNVYIKI